MISFNIKTVILYFFAGGIFLSIVVTIDKAGIAFAQSPGNPISLAAPSQPSAPAHVPILRQPVPAQRVLQKIPSDSVFQPRAERPSLRGGSVEVNTLKLIDPDTVGVLDFKQGGFGENMWAGMRRKTVDRLLPHIPVNTASWAMRDLMRRLLLSIASVPEGDGNGRSLVALRIRLLKAMGDLRSVDDLLTVTPNRDKFLALARLESEALLLSNDNARACKLTAKQMSKSDDSYWQKIFG
jgi:hypothetical protein